MRPLSDAGESEFSKVKYVLTDMDDTLTYRGKLSARTYGALEQLQVHGIRVVPVTAAPAGWCDQMARMWPVDAVVGENGGFYTFRQGDHVKRVSWLANHQTAEAREHLLALQKHIKASLPSSTLASDHPFRLTSVAWDRPANSEDAAELLKAVLAFGARGTQNAIWVLGWYGDYQKLTMARRMMRELYAVDIDRERDEIVYVGDSVNDGPMFDHFPNSVGVSTVVDFLPQLPKPPTWVTKGPGGEGFVEIAEAVIRSVRR
jgi:HAD superfamily hydrolase (TIGR01484 family)